MPNTTIYHIDVNSAFLSWSADYFLREHMTDTDIRTIPAVIGGDESMRHGIVLAKSTSAKKFGVKTGEPLIRAREKCPGLKVFPPNHKLYTQRSREFITLLKSVAPKVEQYSIDEAFCDMSGTENLYGNLVDYADSLRERIYRELRFTVNIGVSVNKLLAKMASDFEKPDKTHTLFPEEIPAKMWPLPVRELFFVGKSIWNYANGRDLESVTGHDSANKGYSSETTLAADMTDPETAKIILLSLAETVAARIRADKAYISVVGVTLVTCEFEKYSHQKSLFSPTNITEEIYHTAVELFAQMWKKEPIRLIGLSTSKATSDQTYQYDLFHKDQYERLSKLNSALDSIRDKYGSGAVKRACFLKEED